MNWSTRLRRWVRIRTPPVREALDEADRGDGLAGAGRVLEPEAARGAGVLGGLLDHLLVLARRPLLPVLGLLVGGELLVLDLVGSSSSSSSTVVVGAGLGSLGLVGLGRLGRLGCRRSPSPLRRSSSVTTCCSAISSARVPESASTWCGLSSAPSRSFGGSSASRRSSPSSSEKSRRHSIEGFSAPSSISLSAASSARRRAVPGASASGPSPSSRKGSRANAAARSMSALEGTAARAATSLVLAIEGFWVPPPPSTRHAAGTSERGLPESPYTFSPTISAARIPANRTYVL